MEHKAYTPSTINYNFSIPLYQRLFEWDKEEVEQLLKDLFTAFSKNKKEPYYIGVLTVYNDKTIKRYSLVDGQQRFTVLTLIGIVLGWKEFLNENNELRLSFFARKKDQEYLQAKIDGKEYPHPNQKMEDAISVISTFIENIDDNDKREEFKLFVYNQTTFFLSELPENYAIQELNQYFEAMNEAGKGLENHEILKVKLLKELQESDWNECTKIWNIVSDMDNCIITQKNDEKNETYAKRVYESFYNPINNALERYNISSDSGERKPIKKIDLSPKKPDEVKKENSEKSILLFSDFLLQVLWLTLEKDENKIGITDFFNKHKLLETFGLVLLAKPDKAKIKSFFYELWKYRLYYDYYIIRLLNRPDGQIEKYTINLYFEDNTKEKLIQYQSMLHVSTSSYIWLSFMLKAVRENNFHSYSDLLGVLKKWDNERHRQSKINLQYGSIDRYWFWRLDYYLWEKIDNYFKDAKAKTVADKYIFKANRSIEHIAPQTPKNESNVNIEEDMLHVFGNLAMISAGQNSSLKNKSYEEKKAHVESFISSSVGGTIESLKMLKIHEYNTWNKENIKEHNNLMIDILKDSFDDIFEIKNHLESLKIN